MKIIVGLILISLSGAMLIPMNSSVLKLPELKGIFGNSEFPVIQNKTYPRLSDDCIVIFKEGYQSSDYATHKKRVQEHLQSVQKRGLISKIKDKIFTNERDSLDSFKVGKLVGYSAKLTEAMVQSLELDPMVDYIERDQDLYLSDINPEVLSEFKTQWYAPWGLERISRRRVSQWSYIGRYTYNEKAGKGVTAYVIDSGINSKHSEFEGRVKDSQRYGLLFSKKDRHGHGSHVAGIIGSKTYGVAKKVEMVSLKVFGSLGISTGLSVLHALSYAVQSHQHRVSQKDPTYKGAIINLLLGINHSRIYDSAVEAVTQAGLTVVAAAGNSKTDACKVSPASSKTAITVAASGYEEEFAFFSNWGKCVDIIAPGVLIQSVDSGFGKSAIHSGTSMAAPFVSGVAALILSLQPDLNSEYSSGKLMEPKEVKDTILKLSTKGILKDVPPDTPNRLLYNGGDTLTW